MKMVSLKFIAAVLLGTGLGSAFAQQTNTLPELTAVEIVNKNAAARGGKEAWLRINTMVWTGHVESAKEPGRKMPFMLEQKRPNNARFEITTEGQKSVRVYNGTAGWKLRSNSGGKPELQPYSVEELKFAQGAQVIEGPLMDFAARGNLITLAGIDELDGRKAYVLDIKLPVGGLHQVWVDGETFLEARFDRGYRNAAGQPAVAKVLYRDYRPFEGLQLPLTVEMGVATNRLVIERIALNPVLDDREFAKPAVAATRRAGATVVDTRSASASVPPRPVTPH
jgi:outer membrane lipoprotein-sorting protein